MKLKLLFLVLFNVTISIAQEKCGFEKHQRDLFAKDPIAKKAYEEAELRLMNTDIQKFLKNKKVKSNTVYEIPIVVHLMNDGTTPLRTDAEVIAWVDNCNKFYNNTYGGAWYTTAQGGTVIPFKLVLAKRSPSCTTTNGIVQVNVTATYPQYSVKGCNSDNTDGVSNVQLRALSRWDPQVYYNAYIVNTFDSVPVAQTWGLQGYAGFPSNPDNSYDTFMKASVVVNTGDPTTLPHEFGHSMGLHHPFRNGTTSACPSSTGNCLLDNDLVCDTPSTKSLLGVNPLPANGDSNPCDAAGWNNVQFNVMNYTNSNRLFTAGQRDRAIAMFLQSRENLTKSLGGTALSGTPPSVATTTCNPPNTPTHTGNFNAGPNKVIIGTINNVSQGSFVSNSNQVFYDYTTKSCLSTAFKTNLALSSNPHNLTVRSSTNYHKFSAWIDYNNNGTFESNELIVTDQLVAPDTDVVFSFTIPQTATFNTPLRLRVIGDLVNSSTSPCGQRAYGQVEDYEVTITNEVSNSFTLNQTSGEINFTQSFPVTGDVTIAGTTNAVGQGAGVTASIGMSFTDTNPNTWNLSHSWKILNYGSDNGNADVYTGNIGPMYQNAGSDVWYWSPGVYYFATRFTHNSTNYYGGVSTGNLGGTWDGTTYKNGKLKILTQVRASQGGTTYKGTNIPINADGVVNASDYTFEFRDATNDALITEVTTSTPVTNFGVLMANATSRTYKIRVKANITGGESLPYGPSVNITLDLSTALKPNHCGLIVINHPTAKFEAMEVNGATNYQFEVTVNGGTPEVITTPNAFFNFGQLSSLPGNSAIIGVRVRAQIGGNYAEYGTSCNVFTKTQITQLFFSHCSLQLPANNGTVVLNAFPVMNATNYEFEVTVNGGTPQTINGANSYFSFSQLSAIPGTGASIAVKVRATVNNVAGDWGNTCTVNTGAIPRLAITRDFKEISAYPNPFYNSFTVKLIDNSNANIKIFEINGRIISNTSVNDKSEIELGNNLPTGIYLVKVEQNNETYSFKMVKN
jgi:GEVED domain/Pregnancy-associated plasma protein-A/Secretion system C-terminal sorting domain